MTPQKFFYFIFQLLYGKKKSHKRLVREAYLAQTHAESAPRIQQYSVLSIQMKKKLKK